MQEYGPRRRTGCQTVVEQQRYFRFSTLDDVANPAAEDP